MCKSLFAFAFLALVVANGRAEENIYLASFAIFSNSGARSCAFVRVMVEPQRTVAHFQPSTRFQKAACSHFNAVWLARLPDDTAAADYEIAIWHKEAPDVPTFFQQASM